MKPSILSKIINLHSRLLRFPVERGQVIQYYTFCALYSTLFKDIQEGAGIAHILLNIRIVHENSQSLVGPV